MTEETLSPDERKRCLAPVVDHRTRLLVLGSLPGDKSLAAQEYYGNRQNKFWMLMSEVIDLDLVSLDYTSRLDALLAHGVGLWDVVAEAHRKGSLDSRIRERNDNDLCGLLSSHPNIEAIAFNGGTAGRLGLRVLGEAALAYQILELPSSSPAHTLPYADKARQWQHLRSALAAKSGRKHPRP
ncbi:MAG TPA: DNA-deoxyinosine glycosylase [Telluria sp.]|nr:DNA-deoxyinosine glycosylase [Telluria sp.]